MGHRAALLLGALIAVAVSGVGVGIVSFGRDDADSAVDPFAPDTVGGHFGDVEAASHVEEPVRPALAGRFTAPTEAERRAANTSALAALIVAAERGTAPPLHALPVHGRVVDARGYAVPDVRITVDGPNGRFVFTSGEEGRFEHALQPGRYRVLLDGGRDGVRHVPSFLVDGTLRDEPIEWSLGPAVTLIVSLVAEGGSMAGIPMEVQLKAAGALVPLVTREATTDMGGIAVFDGLPTGTYLLRARSGEMAWVESERRVDRDMRVDIKVGAPVRLNGTVRAGEEDGPPVAAALVRWRSDQRGGTSAHAETTTDGAGRFEIWVPRGSSQLTIEATGFAIWPGARMPAAASKALQRLRRESSAELLAVLETGGGIRGRVLDTVDRVVPGVRIEAHRGRVGEEPARIAVSDAEGRYELPNLPVGTYELAVTSEGALPATGPKLTVRLRGTADESVEKDIVIVGVRRVSGVVTTAEGAPAIGARVWVFGGGGALRSARRAGNVLEAWTDMSGRFVLFDLPGDRDLTLRATYRELEATPWVLHKDAVADGVNLKLEASGSVVGVVRDEFTGRPVRGASVRVHPGKSAPPGYQPHSATTDADGRFVIRNILPGTWSVLPQASGYLAARATSLTTRRGAEATTDLSLDPGIVLEGIVVDPFGRAIRATVSATQRAPGRTTRSVRTDGSGAFRLTGLPRDMVWDLHARATGSHPASVLGFDRPASGLRLVLTAKTPRK